MAMYADAIPEQMKQLQEAEWITFEAEGTMFSKSVLNTDTSSTPQNLAGCEGSILAHSLRSIPQHRGSDYLPGQKVSGCSPGYWLLHQGICRIASGEVSHGD